VRYLLRRGLVVYYDADWSLLALTDGLNLLTEDGGALFQLDLLLEDRWNQTLLQLILLDTVLNRVRS
jgi:hypothetical protein